MTTRRRSKRGKVEAPPIDPDAGMKRRKPVKKVVKKPVKKPVKKVLSKKLSKKLSKRFLKKLRKNEQETTTI